MISVSGEGRGPHSAGFAVAAPRRLQPERARARACPRAWGGGSGFFVRRRQSPSPSTLRPAKEELFFFLFGTFSAPLSATSSEERGGNGVEAKARIDTEVLRDRASSSLRLSSHGLAVRTCTWPGPRPRATPGLVFFLCFFLWSRQASWSRSETPWKAPLL